MSVPPHLKHLPTWRGIVVPFINIWSDEADEHAMIHAPDATVRRDGWFTTGEQGIGDPDFKRQCPQRQRLVTFYGLCQVCTRPVPSSERNLLVMATKLRQVEDAERVLLSEPWICDPCVDYVQEVCPGVRREQPELLRVVEWDLSIEMSWHDDYGPDVAAAMWINVIPLTVIVEGERRALLVEHPRG